LRKPRNLRDGRIDVRDLANHGVQIQNVAVPIQTAGFHSLKEYVTIISDVSTKLGRRNIEIFTNLADQ
jgi:hypothetical protein